MKEKNVYFVKHNVVVYALYYCVMSLFLGVLKLFVRKDNHLILFVSYGGRYYNDSPKNIYDGMLGDERYKKYKLVWAFRNPEKYPDIKNKVKIDTLQYYIIALRSRCWVTNVAIERGLSFKNKNTFYFFTTHTTLPKLTGYDYQESGAFKPFARPKFDCSCACSEYEAELQPSMFRIPRENVLLSGYPKNDDLLKFGHDDNIRIKRSLGIPECKKIIMYAPTYREGAGSVMDAHVDLYKWRDILGPDFILLFRAHPTMASGCDFNQLKDFALDVSAYPDNTELMSISDILISDYSGIFFEYAVLERPMYCYAYDYEEYIVKRPLYFDIRKELPGGMLDEEGLLACVKSPSDDDLKLVKHFREKYVTVYGNATSLCLDRIINEIA